MADFENIECNSIEIFLMGSVSLSNKHPIVINYKYKNYSLSLIVEQCVKRSITVHSNEPISIEQIWDFYIKIEKLLMLFDGRFLEIEDVKIGCSDLNEYDYKEFDKKYLSNRLSYYETDQLFKCSINKLIEYDEVLTSDLIGEWIKILDELDIVHQVVLYSTALTGITVDIKCAYLIQSMEPLTEIIKKYNTSFEVAGYKNKRPTLKNCIAAVVSKYGNDIFEEEYNISKDNFLTVLVNTRVRIMHIKQKQGKIYLTGEECNLYLVKLFYLYRIAILSIIGIDYDAYRDRVINGVHKLNEWNGILYSFEKRLQENKN